MVTNSPNSPGTHRNDCDLPGDLNELLGPRQEKVAQARSEPQHLRLRPHIADTPCSVLLEARCGTMTLSGHVVS